MIHVKPLIFSGLFAVTMLFSAFGLLVPTSVVGAQEPASCQLQSSSFLGLPTWYKYLNGEEDVSRLGVCSPVIEDPSAILPIGLAVLDGLLRFAGVVAVVMIFWASFKYLTSQGNGDTAAEARRTAINALIGLVIVIIASSLVTFVGNRLIGSSIASTPPNVQNGNNGSGPL